MIKEAYEAGYQAGLQKLGSTAFSRRAAREVGDSIPGFVEEFGKLRPKDLASRKNRLQAMAVEHLPGSGIEEQLAGLKIPNKSFHEMISKSDPRFSDQAFELATDPHPLLAIQGRASSYRSVPPRDGAGIPWHSPSAKVEGIYSPRDEALFTEDAMEMFSKAKYKKDKGLLRGPTFSDPLSKDKKFTPNKEVDAVRSLRSRLRSFKKNKNRGDLPG